jgi:hypothetical protein
VACRARRQQPHEPDTHCTALATTRCRSPAHTLTRAHTITHNSWVSRGTHGDRSGTAAQRRNHLAVLRPVIATRALCTFASQRARPAHPQRHMLTLTRSQAHIGSPTRFHTRRVPYVDKVNTQTAFCFFVVFCYLFTTVFASTLFFFFLHG